tara:strand:- start:978 stop:2444 length:1467 start_codon:yes stop_codon:yes gene_type:complete
MAHPKKSVNFSTPRNASKHGRFGDSLIAFLSPQAQAHLASKDNVLATINPLTGLPEYADISEEDSFANDKWVNDMYSQVFDREADTEGADYWSGRLDDGTASQDDIMKSFLESNEYDEKQMDPDYNIDTVYDDVFGREADEGGRTAYQEQYDTTATDYDAIINGMFGSKEFTQKYEEPAGVEDVTEAVENLDTFSDDDGTFSMEDASAKMNQFYDEHSINDADTAGGDYWAGRLDNATSETEISEIEQAFLTALSNDNGIDSDSGSFINDASSAYLNEGSGYIEPTEVDWQDVKDGDLLTATQIEAKLKFEANIAAGLNGDGTAKTLDVDDDDDGNDDGNDDDDDGTTLGDGTTLVDSILDKAADIVDSSSSDSEETKETVIIASEDGGEEAINVVNEALLGNSNLSEIMALLDRSNLRDVGVRYLRAIRDNQGNRIFYNMNSEEFNQNRNQLRRLYWGKGWKAVDNAEDDSGYGSRAAATTNFLGGA